MVSSGEMCSGTCCWSTTAMQAILRLPSHRPGYLDHLLSTYRTSRWSPSEPLETRGFEWYRGRKQLRQLLMQRLGRYRHTSRTGTFFEAHRLAKRVLDLHLAESEPFLTSGAEQQIVHTAKVEGQDRRCYIVPFQYARHVRGKGRKYEDPAWGACPFASS